MSIQVDHVTKRFGTFTVLNDVSLHAQAGELIALLGPSGCGKTTLLRILAGLERPDHGRILLHGTEVTDQRITDRRVGFVFQHYALFRHMTVTENVSFGLRVLPPAQRPSSDKIQQKVNELLSLVLQMRAMADRYPNQLSGGQRQRVALARALAVEPKLLLLDEPFGALDAKVRKELRRWLRRLHDELHITSILVTHDQEEALEAADRVAVLNQGHIEQIGTPDEVYENPATPFVYQFLGDVNVFHGRIANEHTPQADASGQPPKAVDQLGEHEVTFVRPHDLELSLSRTTTTQLEATVRFAITAGSRVRLELASKDSPQTITVELARERYRELNLRQGDVVFVHPKQLQVFRMPGLSPE
jgi:sulfate transport system ATP-binding protein